MAAITVLRRGWKETLASVVKEAEDHLLICSPYVSRYGTDFINGCLSGKLRESGRLTFVTDLSPVNVAQGSTDPNSLYALSGVVPRFAVMHLPRLHAKVYVSDAKRAVITSGNLTTGGLMLNYESGVQITDPVVVDEVRRDVISYADLGALVSAEQLLSYCQAAEKVRSAFHHQQASATKALRQEFERTRRVAEDELIRMRLAGGAIHTVFAKTILYLLQRHAGLTTEQVHGMIEEIHPDLCDNTVDRVIDGKSFGKKWKHAVRTAQQNLKHKGLIELRDDQWKLVGSVGSTLPA
jgi:hypothetical protein